MADQALDKLEPDNVVVKSLVPRPRKEPNPPGDDEEKEERLLRWLNGGLLGEDVGLVAYVESESRWYAWLREGA